MCGVLVVGLMGCSGSTAKKGAATTTIAKPGSTIRIAPTVAPIATIPVTATTTTVGSPVAAAAPVANSSASGTSSVRATTATTAAGRVVTSPSDNVHLGDTGSGVKQVQTALAAQGYAVSVDGQFGTLTETAVKSFQAKRGLKQDGIVGAATWAKLQTAATTATTKPTTKPTTTLKSTTTVKR